MATFKSRLLAAQRAGDLTSADLQHWFDRAYPTVRYWLVSARDDYEPPGARGRQVKERLYLLEWAIAHNIGFPIPLTVSTHERPTHIKKVRDAVDVGVSEGDPAGGRLQGSGGIS